MPPVLQLSNPRPRSGGAASASGRSAGILRGSASPASSPKGGRLVAALSALSSGGRGGRSGEAGETGGGGEGAEGSLHTSRSASPDPAAPEDDATKAPQVSDRDLVRFRAAGGPWV